MVMQSMKDGRLGLGLSLPCSLLLTGSMKGLFLQRLSEMGLSVSGDSGTEHLAFPVAVHAVMHNLLYKSAVLQQLPTLQAMCFANGRQVWQGQRPRRSLCQERCSQLERAAVAVMRVKR